MKNFKLPQVGLRIAAASGDRAGDGGNACRRPCIAKDVVHEKFTVAKITGYPASLTGVGLIENTTPCRRKK